MKYLILILFAAALLWVASVALSGRRRPPHAGRDRGSDGGGGGSGDSGGGSSTSCDGSDGSDGGCGGGDGGGGD